MSRNRRACRASPRDIYAQVIAMVLFGIGGACGFVPTLPAMERGVKTLGPSASDAISGAYWTLYYLGEGIGPFIGADYSLCGGSGTRPDGSSAFGLRLIVILDSLTRRNGSGEPSGAGVGFLRHRSHAWCAIVVSPAHLSLYFSATRNATDQGRPLQGFLWGARGSTPCAPSQRGRWKSLTVSRWARSSRRLASKESKWGSKLRQPA